MKTHGGETRFHLGLFPFLDPFQINKSLTYRSIIIKDEYHGSWILGHCENLFYEPFYKIKNQIFLLASPTSTTPKIKLNSKYLRPILNSFTDFVPENDIVKLKSRSEFSTIRYRLEESKRRNFVAVAT